MKRNIIVLVGMLVLASGIFAQNKGAIIIQCDMSGAQVLLNGRLIGNTTPNFSTLVPPGNYTVTVRKAGYRDYNNSFALTAGGITLQVFLAGGGGGAPLLPAPNTLSQAMNYNLSVQSNVNGAAVFINGNQAGQTPFSAQVPPGSYSVLVRAPGFLDYNQSIIVGNGPAQVNAMLQGQNQMLTVQSNVNGAVVFINGNQAGQTPFSTQVPAGSYTVLVRAPGYTDFNQNVMVGNGPAQVNAMLQGMFSSWQLSLPDNMRVRDMPGQARGLEIWIDGVQQPTAQGQMSAGGQLTPGRHVIRLVSGSMATETQVDIQAGRSYIFEPYLGLNVK